MSLPKIRVEVQDLGWGEINWRFSGLYVSLDNGATTGLDYSRVLTIEVNGFLFVRKQMQDHPSPPVHL